MIDTNALLSIAFSIVSNFTNAVYIPPHSVPQNTSDLEAFGVARHLYPVDVYLRHKKGTQFWIINGAVQLYYTPGTCFGLQDPSLIEKRLGPARLGTNQVLDLATNAVRRLIEWRPPCGHRSCGQTFRAVPWPSGSVDKVVWPRGKSDDVASVEVDARSGLMVTLSLHDPGFHDLPFTQQITHQVCKPEPPQPKSQRKVALPRPPANEVTEAISNRLRLCQKLKIDPGSQTNFVDVNWDETFVFESQLFSRPRPVCRVTFNNDTSFDSFGGQVFNAGLWDTYYGAYTHTRWEGKLDQFKGTIKYRWEDLATGFERLLTLEFGIPEKAMSRYRSRPQWETPPVGTNDFARVSVAWREWPNRKGHISINETRVGFMVEFDLRTAEIKGFGFHDPGLIEAFGRGQAQTKQPRK